MASVALTDFFRSQVIQFNLGIHTRREQEISSIVEFNCPDRLLMFEESARAARVSKVPNFNSFVARRGGEMGASRVEVNPTDPIFMPLA